MYNFIMLNFQQLQRHSVASSPLQQPAAVIQPVVVAALDVLSNPCLKTATCTVEHGIQILYMPGHEAEEDTTSSYREDSPQKLVFCTGSHVGKAP
nr:hypothetical protein Iba_scaffold14897CG0130 [Ipomoea batatas]